MSVSVKGKLILLKKTYNIVILVQSSWPIEISYNPKVDEWNWSATGRLHFVKCSLAAEKFRYIYNWSTIFTKFWKRNTLNFELSIVSLEFNLNLNLAKGNSKEHFRRRLRIHCKILNFDIPHFLIDKRRVFLLHVSQVFISTHISIYIYIYMLYIYSILFTIDQFFTHETTASII